jgi:uncharacterized protein (DUF1015 family)
LAGVAKAGDSMGSARDGAIREPHHTVEVEHHRHGAILPSLCQPLLVPRFEPFRGIRYDPRRVDVQAVVAPPYDVLSASQRDELARRDPHNVVHVDVPREEDGPNRYADAAELFAQWRHDGVLVTDAEPAFYLYRVSFTDESGLARHLSGVVGALAVQAADEPGADVLPHEQTTPKATTDRLDLTRATEANLSPIWGLSLAPHVGKLAADPGELLAEVTDDGGVVHRLERVDDPARVDAIRRSVASAPVLVADGHHRYGVARTYRRERREETGGGGPYDYTLAFVQELAEDQLVVRALHRLIRDVPDGVDVARELARSYDMDDAGPVTVETTATMRERGVDCLVLPDGAGRFLAPRSGAVGAETDLASARLDAALADVPHTLAYEPDVDAVLAALATGDAQAAVLLRPVTVAQIEATAHEGALMPPKSTFFWPKLRTGLVFRSLA